MKLKQIIESESRDMNYALTTEEKRNVLDAVSKFNEYGQHIYRTSELKEMAKSIKYMSEMASKLALDEAGDWFDAVTVKRDMKEVKSAVSVFDKTVSEMSALQQRLESIYEDMGHKLGRYYNINEKLDPVGQEDGDIDNDGDKDDSDKYLAKKRAAITKAIKNESKEVYVEGSGRIDEQAPRMKDSKETKELQSLYLQLSRAKKGGLGNRYAKEFETAKKKAQKAINNMIMYSKIGN